MNMKSALLLIDLHIFQINFELELLCCFNNVLSAVGWPVGERLGIELEGMVMDEENRPYLYVPFSFKIFFFIPI